MNELLIKNGLVSTYIYEGYHSIKLKRADVYVLDGVIAEVAPGLKKDCDTLEAAGCLVLPGMVNLGSSTFAARLMSGLLYDTKHSGRRIRPMLELAGELLSEEEVCAVAASGLWQTLASGATTVAELCRDVLKAECADPEQFPYDGALPKSLLSGMNRAAELLGINLLLAQRAADGTLLLPEAAGGNEGDGSAIPVSAVTCAHTGMPYTGYGHVKRISRTAVSTGCFDSCMLTELRAVALALKQDKKIASAYNSSDVYKSSDAFYSATVVGGRALNQRRYGRIGPGFYGDLSVVCMDRFAPLCYPISQYVYGADAGDVKHVICRGIPCKRDDMPAQHLQEALEQAQTTARGAIEKVWEEARRRIL